MGPKIYLGVFLEKGVQRLKSYGIIIWIYVRKLVLTDRTVILRTILLRNNSLKGFKGN